ncbi:hypothetical protein [Singulisphaera acidiphila]|uniref:Helix-turn-helix domain-containing protein n=1 Tax=Singulisphaera acidiphila (strain ATCC BAA-1392 / DSM 18658 / VKM B-2454 / MOB10) TaxID=886293 RepID=L0D9H8_SINAD|nr:hypothetical protein [Singulisphaera acidiphila]AGA26049.1 hypothetical protein Sinac_1673 [Singulisphaera acidiphila DSM 18658]
MGPSPAKLLTIADLAERWGCNERFAWERVKERGIRFVWLGKGSYDASKHGPKMVRFRLQAIEEWELSEEKHHEAVEPIREVLTHASTRASRKINPDLIWDGVVRS